MAVYFNEKRGRWLYDFRRGGERYAGYAVHPDTGAEAASRRKAQEIEALIKARVDKAVKEDRAAAARPGAFTLAQCLAYYAEHVGKQRRTWEHGIKPHIKELLAHFGPATPVEELTISDVRAYIAWARKQPVRHYVGGRHAGGKVRELDRTRSASTINKYLNTLRAALNLAREDEKVRRVPHVPREEEPEDNPNPIQVADLERILAAAPDHLRDVLTLCTMTGMRQQECVQLTWRQVNLEDGVVTLYAADVKANKGRPVFLNEVAKAVLERLDAARPLPRTLDQRVILYRHKGKGRPRPINSIDKAWYSTLQRVGLKEDGAKGKYRFHDTRAAFCSYLASLGVDPVHIKELAGHASITTTMKYVKASDERLRASVALLGGKLAKAEEAPAAPVASPAGIEPATPNLEGSCSIQLSYGPQTGTCANGAGTESHKQQSQTKKSAA